MIVQFVLAAALLLYAGLDLAWRFESPLIQTLRQSTWFIPPQQLKETGYRQLWNGDSNSLPQAIETFRSALNRDPASPYRWCDLGEVLIESGQVDQARYCFSRALDLGANSPRVLLRIANFYFRVDEKKSGFEYMARILSRVSEYDPVIFSAYSRLGGDIDTILRDGIPAEKRPAVAFFKYLLHSGKLSDVRRTWAWMISHSLSNDRLAVDYVDYLTGHHEYEVGAQEWAAYMEPRQKNYLKSDYLFNGDFEFETTDAFFDWRITPASGAEVVRDSTVARSGRWSLRITFNGTDNLLYQGTSQAAFVRPGTYRFEAQVKTDKITTDQGIGFRILDLESEARLDIRVEHVTGTGDWKEVSTVFQVKPPTRLIAVRLDRQRSWKFDNKISGSAWIDLVKVIPAGSIPRK